MRHFATHRLVASLALIATPTLAPVQSVTATALGVAAGSSTRGIMRSSSIHYTVGKVSVLTVAIVSVAAAQTIGVNVGTSPSVITTPGATLIAPLIIDLTNAGGASIRSIQFELMWNAGQLTFDSVVVVAPGWSLQEDLTDSQNGVASVSATSAAVLSGSATLANLFFTTGTGSGGARIRIVPTTADDAAGQDIQQLLSSQGFDVCVATTGIWGDVNNDGAVNIIDAQQIARYSVGLTIANAVAVAQRGDVTASDGVDIIDAQQIARFSVGLSAAARINQSAFTPPVPQFMYLTPALPAALSVGGSVRMMASPRDRDSRDISGCASVSWSSSNPGVARVSQDGVVTAVGNGSTTIFASSGGISFTQNVNVTPSAGSWLSLPDMPEARDCHAAFTYDGKIFVLGGIRSSGGMITIIDDNNQLTSVVVFDPITRQWSQGPTMPSPRTCSSAVLFGNRVFLVGGITSHPTRYAETTLVFDPAGNSWSTTGGLPRPRYLLNTTVVGGVLYAAGGLISGPPVSDIDQFDVNTGTWSTVGQLNVPTHSHGMVTTGESFVIVGGQPWTTSSRVESYTPPTLASHMLADIPGGRTSATTVQINGEIYSFGGSTFPAGDWIGFDNAGGYRYDPALLTWSALAPMRRSRGEAVAVVLNGAVYVLGGMKGISHSSACFADCTQAPVATVEVFRPGK